MSQQYPPNGGRGSYNGRGPGQGGRVTGRGGGMVPQQPQVQQQQQPPPQQLPPPQSQQQQPQQQQYNNYQTGGRDRGGPRPTGAWQQTQQTQQGSSLQQQAAAAAAASAGGYPVVSQQQQPPSQGQGRPMQATGGYAPMGGVPYYQHAYGGAAHPGQWQQQPTYMAAPHQHTNRGMYYPPNGQPVVPTLIPGPIPQSQVAQPVVPREKKPLIIMDKSGNVLSFDKPVTSSLQTAAAVAKGNATTTTTINSAPPAPVTQPTSDAGAKMREIALARISGKSIDSKTDKDAEEKAKAAAAENAKIEQENKAKLEKAKQEAEEKLRLEEKIKQEQEEALRLEFEEKTRIEAEEKAKAEAAENDRLQAEEQAKKEKEASNQAAASTPGRIVLSKDQLLSYKNDPQCMIRPDTLPEMTIVKQLVNNSKGAPVGGAGQGGTGGAGDRRNRNSQRSESTGSVTSGGGGNWERGGAPPRRQALQGQQDNRVVSGGGGEWSRGQAPPRQQSQGKGRGGGGGGGGGRGGRGGHHQQSLYDGPVAPLIKSDNHWKPRKNSSALVVAEKRVLALLNKMTKEKFDVLAEQMLQIEISTYEILSMMLDNVYDKAIDEPRFGDMYADLCVRLSQSVQGTEFVHIIASDEEPPTEDGTSAPVAGESSSHTVYRWSNDVSTSDSEVVGPLPSEDACIDAALSEVEQAPTERGEMELELVSVVIRRSIFIKIMKKKDSEGGDDDFYTVFFPANEAEECGQALSSIFLSKIECESDSAKKNSFKRSLLNKCEEEFCKQDIYVDWKKEKKEYDETKQKLSETERREKAEELNFRRMRIKKQMLGNVQFIGQLYKKNLLREKIMRYCVASLLKLDENKEIKAKNPEYVDSGIIDTIDEEDHEAICSLFTTIGQTIDKPPAETFMQLCFQKITKLSQEKSLPSRSRFMYKDLLELRGNAWVPRRKEEKAKTIAEIRKDVEIEERRQAEESARAGRGGGNDYRGGGRGQGDARGGSSRYLNQSQTARSRQPKVTTLTDDDGFSLVGGARSNPVKVPPVTSVLPRITPSAPTMNRTTAYDALDDDKDSPTQSSTPAAMSDDLFGRRVKSMHSEYSASGGNLTELLLNFEELTGTPNYGSTLVQKSVETFFESKESEQTAISSILITLCEKGKLTKLDVQSGLQDTIEYIDDIAVDAPKAKNQLGDLIGQMLVIKVIDLLWLCDQLDKTKSSNPQTTAPEDILRFSLQRLRKSGSPDQTKAPSVENRIVSLIDADKWQTLQKLIM